MTLACLTGIVPYAFKDACSAAPRHGSEALGLARWLCQAGETEAALKMFRCAIEAGLPDDLLFRTLWDIAALERKLGHAEAALEVWSSLAAASNPFRARSLEELAKHYEHRTRDYLLALDATRAALEHQDSPGLRKRERRLMSRLRPARAR